MKRVIITLTVLYSTTSYADEIERFTEYRCDSDQRIFEMKNFIKIDGQVQNERLDHAEILAATAGLKLGNNGLKAYVENYESIGRQMAQCDLETLPSSTIQIERSAYHPGSQYECGAMSGAEYKISINDKTPIVWSSFYDRCLANFRRDVDYIFPKNPTYIRVWDEGVLICGRDGGYRWRDTPSECFFTPYPNSSFNK